MSQLKLIEKYDTLPQYSYQLVTILLIKYYVSVSPPLAVFYGSKGLVSNIKLIATSLPLMKLTSPTVRSIY